MSAELDGWHWVEWRNTLEPELFKDGRIRDLDGDWLMPAPTRKIGPRIPTPEELKATELKLAKLRNLADDLEKTLAETREERDRLRAEVERLRHVPPTCKESLPVQPGGRVITTQPAEIGGKPEELVRCYRSKSGSGVWVYGVQHNTYFCSHGGWTTAQSESTTIKHNARCTISEAHALLAGLPKSLAKFDRITGRDEDREHLLRLLAIPCKEMRV